MTQDAAAEGLTPETAARRATFGCEPATRRPTPEEEAEARRESIARTAAGPANPQAMSDEMRRSLEVQEAINEVRAATDAFRRKHLPERSDAAATFEATP